MIDQLKGIIQKVAQQEVVMCIHNFCLSINTPQTSFMSLGGETTLYTYLHWSTEQGPSLYGFASQLDREIFLLICQVPKIGPKIALNILGSLNASQIINALQANNTAAFSTISGIGPKKAQHIILYLQDKISKLVLSGAIQAENNASALLHWQQLSDALTSLGYTKQEISHASTHLAQATEGKDIAFDKLLRSALAYLSKQP